MSGVIQFPINRVKPVLNTGPFPAPDRTCLVCDIWAWSWDEATQQYQCVSNAPAHAERQQDMETNPGHYYAYQGGSDANTGS